MSAKIRTPTWVHHPKLDIPSGLECWFSNHLIFFHYLYTDHCESIFPVLQLEWGNSSFLKVHQQYMSAKIRTPTWVHHPELDCLEVCALHKKPFNFDNVMLNNQARRKESAWVGWNTTSGTDSNVSNELLIWRAPCAHILQLVFFHFVLAWRLVWSERLMLCCLLPTLWIMQYFKLNIMSLPPKVLLCQLEFWLLVGTTMLDRLWARGQTKCNTLLMLATSVFGRILLTTLLCDVLVKVQAGHLMAQWRGMHGSCLVPFVMLTPTILRGRVPSWLRWWLGV